MSDQHEATIRAMVKWLEKNQPDVFKRGLWDAIGESAAPQQQSNIGNGHDDWARKHYDEAQQQVEPSEIPHPCDVHGLCAKMNRKCDQCDPQQQAEPVAFADEHVDTFLTQYNDVYCHQRKAGVGGGNAERAAMRQVLTLALGAYKPHITAEQVEQIKRLASLLETRVRAVYVLADDDEDRESLNDDVAETSAALHAALDALKGTP